MLLVVNVGNTETALGMFRGEDLIHHWRMSTQAERTADEMALVFAGFLDQESLSFTREITGVALSSVVPPCTQALREMTRRYFHFDPVVVEPGVRTGVSVRTDNPREVGADRIANAVAAHSKYGGPSIVVDIGTATTYDVITEKGEYVGGAIAPGLRISADALFHQTAKLPRVELVEPASVIGRSTVDAMQAGLVFGKAAEIEGIVERIQKELGGDATVIATGGWAWLIAPLCSRVDHHEPWLTLQGLRLIFERNTEPNA